MTTLHVPPGGWTVDDLPDREDFRYELVDGALLVSPSPTPRHSGVAGRLLVVLARAVGPGWDVLSSIANDRVAKPAQYAAAGIPYFWRIEQDPPVLVRHVLEDGVYREVGRSGGVVDVTEPVAVVVDVDALLA